MRYGEIVKLKWGDINFDMHFITLHETKNGERRIIPLTDDVAKILKEIPTFGSKANELVFSSRHLTPTKYPISIRKSFARALQVAGIESFRFHDLRHTAASYLAMNGATQGELMAILGHRSPTMTRRYAHYSQEHLKKLLEKTNQALNS
jgi:integrase